METKKKNMYKTLDVVWRMIGAFIIMFFIYTLIKYKTISGTFSLIILLLIIVYAIISVIIFLPKIMKRFLNKLKNRKKWKLI